MKLVTHQPGLEVDLTRGVSPFAYKLFSLWKFTILKIANCERRERERV